MDSCQSKFDAEKLLAACFIKLGDGTVCLNVNLNIAGRDDEQVIRCQTPFDLEQLFKAAITVGDDGFPALNLRYSLPE